MRTFDLRQQHITVEELLRLARTESVRIVAEEGDDLSWKSLRLSNVKWLS